MKYKRSKILSMDDFNLGDILIDDEEEEISNVLLLNSGYAYKKIWDRPSLSPIIVLHQKTWNEERIIYLSIKEIEVLYNKFVKE